MSVLRSFLPLTLQPVTRPQLLISRSTKRFFTIMSRALAQEPRRFGALNPDRKSESQAPKLDGIVFDVDGTLCTFLCSSLDVFQFVFSFPTSTFDGCFRSAYSPIITFNSSYQFRFSLLETTRIDFQRNPDLCADDLLPT